MKIIDQQGNIQETFQLEMSGNSLFGQPLNLKKPKVLLGEYESMKRVIEVMSEAYSLNSKDKTLIYTMPKE